jgi:hypothetical protein
VVGTWGEALPGAWLSLTSWKVQGLG